ncbi:hypothetical protein FLP41_16775 [Paracoccus marcusii]|nr:hypothetical protein FLP41_16775 [Paracoccus marcusii]
MGDLVARRSGPFAGTHPAIAAMNALGCDAAALGNHDFNFGLPFLRRAVARARFPMLAANLTVRRGADFAATCVIERELTDPQGNRLPLRIGVIGFLPPQTEEWDQDLRAVMRSDDILDCARRLAPRLRAQGSIWSWRWPTAASAALSPCPGWSTPPMRWPPCPASTC